ncbi:MAG: tetratricopeptide repeat protein [Candidatus Omnitrophica bacterium]|nr:tetratricopeptide repeat protein [Candidatus Omnitrophota bacterium]
MDPQQKKFILDNLNRKSAQEIARELGLKERKIRKVLQKAREEQKKQTAAKKERVSLGQKKIWLSIILIAFFGFVFYSNALTGEFIWDDRNLVIDNGFIRSWDNFPYAFSASIGAGAGSQYSFYRPMQTLTYILDYSLWQLDERGYHLSNIIFHILAALVLFWLINILYDNWLFSLSASLLFVVHPIHTEAVAYISGRADPLAAIFMLLCLIFYIKSLDSPKPGFYILMLAAYACAILSRENSLILPLLLLLYHFGFRKKLALSRFLPILTLAIFYIILRFTVLRFLFAHLTYTTSLPQRLPGFFIALTNYLRLLFLPVNLHMEYGNDIFAMTHPKAILGLLIFLALLFYVFKRRKEHNLALFGILWFLIALLPVSNLYPINAYMSEHWLYLPSIGFFLIVAHGFAAFYKKSPKMVYLVLGLVLLIFYGVLTFNQNKYWQKPLPLYERLLKYNPDAERVYNEVGITYGLMEEYKKAIPYFEKALKLNPAYDKAYNNLATSYIKVDRDEEAVALLEKAIKLNPQYAKAYNTLAIAYFDLGRYEDAVKAGKKAIALSPALTEAHNNVGLAYQAWGKNEEAIPYLEKAIRLRPDDAGAYNNLGSAYGGAGRDDKAIEAFKKAIELKPDYAGAYNNLSLTYFKLKKYPLAVQYCDKAKELGFVNPRLLKLLESYR